MEVIIFTVSITLIAAFGIFGLGVCIGEGIYKRQYVRNNSGNILPCNDSDLSNNTMGDVHTAIDSRQDMGLVEQEVKTVEEVYMDESRFE